MCLLDTYIHAGHVLYIIWVDQPLHTTTIFWTPMACCHSCDLKSYAILHCLKMSELSLSGIWILCYMFLAIWWNYIALYVGMVLWSTHLVSPALSSNTLTLISVEICTAVTIPLKFFPHVSEFIRETSSVTDRLGGHKKCWKTPDLGNAWCCDCMKMGSILVVFSLYVLDHQWLSGHQYVQEFHQPCLFLCS